MRTAEAVTINISFTVNGSPYTIDIEPYKTVLEVLRDDLRLTGTKQGCEDGNCGACTIIMNGKAVKCCSILIGQARDAKILTIEGLEGEDGLHPLQQAFIDHFAIQCGFCTPGMIMMAKAVLDENPHATEEDIREAMHGNLCRCTGYVKIIEAVEAARDHILAGR
ncbi:MAG: (2Fe-2S)-binding protein [Planctomycetaceae bacterium]|nr:(2Fe-2S)-binding protein [Planctomycetaceae bacterium]